MPTRIASSRCSGRGRARILTRLSAFLLLCIGVQILMTGIQGALSTIIAAAADRNLAGLGCCLGDAIRPLPAYSPP